MHYKTLIIKLLEMIQTKQFSFTLASIDELRFSFSALDAIGSDQKPLDTFGVTTNIRYDWNIENDSIGIVLDFMFQKPEDNLEVLRFESRINFVVKDIKSHIEIRDPKADFDMDETLETSLVSISISTIRGILFEKTRGTVFHNHLLPLMDPKKLLVSKLLKQSNDASF